MEDTLIASYITLIIGYLIIENKVTFPCYQVINSNAIKLALFQGSRVFGSRVPSRPEVRVNGLGAQEILQLHESHRVGKLLQETKCSLLFILQNIQTSPQCSVTSSRGIKATETIIKHLEKIDKPPEQEAKVKEENEETFGDISLFDVTKDDDEVGNSKINFEVIYYYDLIKHGRFVTYSSIHQDATLNEDHEED